jgi:hypothetical protein
MHLIPKLGANHPIVRVYNSVPKDIAIEFHVLSLIKLTINEKSEVFCVLST